jgi:hypothetical protein
MAGALYGALAVVRTRPLHEIAMLQMVAEHTAEAAETRQMAARSDSTFPPQQVTPIYCRLFVFVGERMTSMEKSTALLPV